MNENNPNFGTNGPVMGYNPQTGQYFPVYTLPTNMNGQNMPQSQQFGTMGMNPMRGTAPTNQNLQNNSGTQNHYPCYNANNQQQDSFIGRLIGDPVEIKPNEVPMDGRIAIFPTQDLTSIFIKGWNANGEMITVRYIVDPDWKSATPSEAAAQQQDILRRLENVEKSIAASKKTGKNVTKEDKENA